MEFCPSPDHPIVVPDNKGIQLRKKMHILYYGQMIVCLFRFMTLGSFAGIIQLMNLWVCYTAYATLHFCSILIYLMMCSLEITFIFTDYKRALNLKFNTSPQTYQGSYNDPYQDTLNDPNTNNIGASTTEIPVPQETQLKGDTFLIIAFGYITLYNILSVMITYRGYLHFKHLFQVQHVGAFDHFDEENVPDAFNNNDQEEQRYQQDQMERRERFIQRVQQQREPELNPNPQLPAEQQNVNQIGESGPSVQEPENIPRQAALEGMAPTQNVVVHDFRRPKQQPQIDLSNSQQESQQRQEAQKNQRGYVPFSGQGYSLN